MTPSRGNRGARRTRRAVRNIVEQRVLEKPVVGYPSLGEHLATRRRFLEVMGASLTTAGGMLPGCQGSVGPGAGEDAATGGPDASTWPPDASAPPDATVSLPGGQQWPGYYAIRIPRGHSLTATLMDRYRAIFQVDAATHDANSYQELLEHPLAAQDLCRDIVAEQTYEALNTPRGLAEAEDLLLAALDGLVMMLNGHDRLTIEMVALHITELEEQIVMPGELRRPSYP